MKDSIAFSVFLFTVYTLASLAGIDIRWDEFLCGWLMSNESPLYSMISFVFIYSITGFLLSKYIFNLWSGNVYIKLFLFGIIFSLPDLVVALFIFNKAGLGLAIGFLEKLMFGAVIHIFLSIKEKENQIIVKNIKVSSWKNNKSVSKLTDCLKKPD